ncbi:MAG: nuclear transport factor 2 family protein, partial [Noviherbaspirillum sp.]
MPITKLARPIATYIAAANAQDIDAVTASFSGDAVVHDEKQDRQGIAAIRKWAEEVSRKYHPTVEVIGVAETDGRTILTGRVSGDFPGSPIELRYVFTLNGGKIE